MKKTILFTMVALVAGVLACVAETGKIPAAGDKAPTVEAKDQNGKTWKLSDELGHKNVLLYFYPKDDTPGCTKEACGLRDRMGDLQKDDVEVVGVSFDNGASHQKFISKYKLNFTLLQDPEGKIADEFGVRMNGRNMARRVSFLIDKTGKIVHVTDNPKAEVHLDEMKEAVGKLAQK